MAIRQKTSVVTRLSGKGTSHARTDVQTRDVAVVIDEPVERGGTNEGLSPTETALAALIGCTNVIGHKVAAAQGVDIGHLSITLACDFDRRGVTLQEEVDLPFTAIRLRIECDGAATQQELDRVAADVARFCAVSKMMKAAGTLVTEEWVARG